MNPLAWAFSQEMPTGVTVTYWVLKELHVDMMSAKALCKYEGFLDQAAFESGKLPLVQNKANIDFSGFDPNGQLAGGVVELVKLVQNPPPPPEPPPEEVIPPQEEV